MKSIFKYNLCLMTAILLSACGSSGGGSSQSSSNGNTGEMYIISSNDDGHISSIHKQQINSAELTALNIDGKMIALLEDAVAKIKNGFSLKYPMKVEGYSVMVSNQEDKLYLLYNGNPTKEMPNTGVIHYTGGAALVGIEDGEPSLGQGSSKFTANFATKTLNGALDVSGFSPVDIKTSISGNSFNGYATSGSFGSRATVEGKFYGENAMGVSGILKTEKLNDDSGTLGIFTAVDNKLQR